MNYKLLTAIAIVSLGSARVHAEDPAPAIPRTHVDSTVVGDAADEDTRSPGNAASLTNEHGFEAGAPEITRVTERLHLSARQSAQIKELIGKADAGAAGLIRRDNVVRDMLSTTPPEDPMYAKLKAEKSAAASRWAENRDGLRTAVMEVLTPAQRARFTELQSKPTE